MASGAFPDRAKEREEARIAAWHKANEERKVQCDAAGGYIWELQCVLPPPPPPPPPKPQTPIQTASNRFVGNSVWDRLAQCESGGNWAISTGNSYYGGLQFDLRTWQGNGGSGYPHQNSRETQIMIAERVRANRGFYPWPACARKLGLI